MKRNSSLLCTDEVSAYGVTVESVSKANKCPDLFHKTIKQSDQRLILQNVTDKHPAVTPINLNLGFHHYTRPNFVAQQNMHHHIVFDKSSLGTA